MLADKSRLNTDRPTAFRFCLTSLFFPRLLHVWPDPPYVFRRKTLETAGAKFCYRTDALPVIQLTAPKHCLE